MNNPNVVIEVDFIGEPVHLLVDYWPTDEIINDIELLKVRLIRLAPGWGIPTYEAVWLHGQCGILNILSPAQLVAIADLTIEAIHDEGHVSIPEDSITYMREPKWKP